MVTIKYQNVNYDGGNQSTLFTFEDEQEAATYGILVDSGPNLYLGDKLGEDEHLSATLLTHAHYDHIAGLDACLRDAAPIYTSPVTATILEHTLAAKADRLGIENPDAVIDRLQVLDTDWTTLIQDIEVRPIPVGHAPGATGFLLRFDDAKHIFVTGDFTRHDVAGNPGFDPSFDGALQTGPAIQTAGGQDSAGESGRQFSVGTLHLNAPTSENARGELQAALRTVYDRTTSGSQTLVTTSALGGLHMAGLLDALQRAQETQFDIRLAGKVATVYETLEYDFDHMTSIVEFEAADELLSPGSVTIAGPEDASAGSAEALLDAANQDAGNTAVVQLRSAGTDAIDAPWLTTQTFAYSLHPTEDELKEVIKTIEPIQVILSHAADKDTLERWRDYGRDLNTLVWASYGHDRYRLFDDGDFLSPSWVEGGWVNAVLRRNESRPSTTVSQDALPAVGPRAIALAREGIETADLVADSETLQGDRATSQQDAASVALDAGVYRLAELAVEREPSRARNGVATTDMETLVIEAVDWFVQESLRGDLPQRSTGPSLDESLELTAGSPLAKILEDTSSAAADEQLLIDCLRSELGLPAEDSVTYTSSRLAPRLAYIEALVESDDNAFEAVSDVVQGAIEATLLEPELTT